MMARYRLKQDLVILGEFFFDLVFYNLSEPPQFGLEVKTDSFEVAPGGGLATTALVVAGLGTRTQIITRIGRDALPHPAWKRLEEAGIGVKACEVRDDCTTAQTVCVAYGGDRMMVTHDAINHRLDGLTKLPSVRRQLRRARHVHLACALRPPNAWVPILRALRRAGTTLSADIGWNPDVLKAGSLRTVLSQLDFVFPNETEALAMTGTSTAEEAAKQLGRWVRTPVVKLGPAGSLAIIDDELVRFRPMQVQSVDATGAGDAFNGGFLHGYLRRWPLADCVLAGNVCGALATTAPGGSSAIPTPAKLARWMRSLSRRRNVEGPARQGREHEQIDSIRKA
jgi:sugar/nucleoside kinase (ribokinase family)